MKCPQCNTIVGVINSGVDGRRILVCENPHCDWEQFAGETPRRFYNQQNSSLNAIESEIERSR